MLEEWLRIGGSPRGNWEACAETDAGGLMPVEWTSVPDILRVRTILREELAAALQDCGTFAQAKAAKYPPQTSTMYRRTGTLGRRIEVGPVQRSESSVAIEVGTNVPYARYVEEGTGLDGPKEATIYPKYARVLSWVITAGPRAGTRVYARSVRGMAGWHFMEKAITGPRMTRFVRSRLQAALTRTQARL